MPVTGPKKLQKFGGKTGHQFCIDGFLVKEVLKQIPANIKIVGAEVEIGTTLSSKRIPVSTELKKLGVKRLSRTMPNKRAFIVFDEVSKEIIIKTTRKVCEKLDINPDRAQISSIVLQYKDAAGKFERTTKEIKPYSEDLRKKLKVLGLKLGHGKVSDLISALNAKKYFCDIHEEIVRIAICRPE